jgi:Lrp/AsnC family transcriptional regulator, leucine-responsive regulatory protein
MDCVFWPLERYVSNWIAQWSGEMRPFELDATDRRILRELQLDGSLRNDVLAERVALSPAPTLRRVRALETNGVISRYAALLDPERVGLSVRVKVDVRLASQTREGIDTFSKAVSAMAEVVECMILFGEWDYQMTVVARDVDDYQRFVFDKLSKLPNIATYRSTLILRTVKHTTVLPV